MKDILNQKRLEGDKLADDTIRQVVEDTGEEGLVQLRTFLTNSFLLDFTNQPPIVRAFYESIDKTIDKKLLQQNIAFYHHYQQEIGLILACYSLPYCFLAEDGARVLYFSQRMQKDTFRRLLETGDFLEGIFNARAWQNQQAPIRIAKVRLLHALSRYYCLHKSNWDMAWGYPINQEDMAGTNLAFSLIVLRGLEKSGIRIDTKIQQNYLLFWAKIGAMSGVDAALLATNMYEAQLLDMLIAERHFKPSTIGQALCASLLETLERVQKNPILKGFPTAKTRFFLGEIYADWLKVPASSPILNNMILFQSHLTTIFR